MSINRINNLKDKAKFKSYSDIFDFDKSCFKKKKVSLKKKKNYDNLQCHIGIYAVWMKRNLLKQTFKIKTRIDIISIKLVDYLHSNEYVCIYIGKTGTEKNIFNRFSQHLRGNEKSSKIIKRLKKMIDTGENDIIKFIIKNFKYSFIEEKDIAKRFFLENAAISELKPILNIEY